MSEINKNISKLMYSLIKSAARNDFIEFLEEEAGLTEEEFDEIQKWFNDQGIKTYFR